VWVKTEQGLSRIRKTDSQVWNYGYTADFAYDGRTVWIVAKGHFAKYDEDTDTDEEVGSDSLPVGNSILLDGEYAWTFGWHYVSGYNVKSQTWDKHGRSQYSLRFLVSDMDFFWFANVDVFGAPQGISRFVRIPEHADHPFRSMPTTHSGPCRPPIPEHAVHLIGASNDAG